jgi:putative SOS response-associated peptidase YedK
VLKQPYYLTTAGCSVMAFAGLWEYWRSPDGDPLVSMTIITSDAVGPMREIHDRMPLILPVGEWDASPDMLCSFGFGDSVSLGDDIGGR